VCWSLTSDRLVGEEHASASAADLIQLEVWLAAAVDEAGQVAMMHCVDHQHVTELVEQLVDAIAS
jgi:hypothetical protein